MKKLLSSVIWIIMTFLSLGCGNETKAEPPAVETVVERPDPIDELLNSMTLTEKIGQMVMIGIHGTDVDEDSLYMLNQFHFGGVILFQRNLDSLEQTARLASNLQSKANEKVPLFIAIDEEGGRVSRLGHLIESAPSQQSLGQSGSLDEAKLWSSRTSQNLKSIGINVNFAPVADVGNDSRDFGSDPKLVADFVDAAAQSYEDSGVIYCLKHFPGIGLGVVDSHEEISSINASLDDLFNVDLVPFKRVIDKHPHDRFMIMATHIKFPALDNDNSASLSPNVLTKLLRERLGFDGIIITDDLEMGAAAKHNLFREVGVKAIAAGADIALICHEYAHEQSVYLGILEAVKRGEISEERINQSVRRILRAKLNNLAVNGAD